MSLPGIRGVVAAIAMQGFLGAQRLDAVHLQAQADQALVESSARFVEHHAGKYRSAPGKGRGVGSKLSKPRGHMRRGR
jgi:hypothetical protein